MKKVIISIALLTCLSIISARGQGPSTRATLQADESYEYCQILGEAKLMSSKLNIYVDYGQEWNIWTGREKMKDENGKNMKFNSMIDALNYMSTSGWDFVQAYAIAVSGQNVYHYLMRRKIKNSEVQTLNNK